MDFPGFWEMVTLAVLALLIFGPDRLPKMARDAGRLIAKFKAEASATMEELKQAAELDELTSVRDEIKDTARELKATGADLKSAAGDVRAGLDLNAANATSGNGAEGLAAATAGAAAATSRPTGAPAPFDPDTP